MIPLRDSQPSNSTPFVTLLLIGVNVVVFLYEVSLDHFSLNHFISVWGMVPAELQYRTLITSMFLHGGWMHLIGNMWFLWIYGDNVEDILGAGKYLVFYFACGIAAAFAHILTNPGSAIPTVGASGAIAGVMGAYLLKFPHSKILTLIPIFVVFTTIEISAWIILVYWFVIQIFSGVGSVAYSEASEGGIAFFAHIGGFVAGIALIKLIPTRQRYRARRELYW
ncbi:MAG: rhomboid family intramembrane serine protease [Bryobacteraceae bacterium]|nr:rhomboid family intramembrane serine protease [Bryobacteraceae bacterium]